MIEEAVVPLRMAIEAMSTELEEVVNHIQEQEQRNMDKETIKEVWLMVKSLTETSPIFFDEDEEQYFCKCCFASIQRTPDILESKDIETFPHEKVCPVARAKRIKEKLQAEAVNLIYQ